MTFVVTMLFMFYVRSPNISRITCTHSATDLRHSSTISQSLPISSPHVSKYSIPTNKPTTNVIFSAMEIFVTCLWIATVALLSWECQTWDAAEDVVSDVLTTEQAAMVNSLPNQDSGILSLRAATALASINCVFWAVTLFICKAASAGWKHAMFLLHSLTYKLIVRRVLLYSVDI